MVGIGPSTAFKEIPGLNGKSGQRMPALMLLYFHCQLNPERISMLIRLRRGLSRWKAIHMDITTLSSVG